jgi:hypothetical protein
MDETGPAQHPGGPGVVLGYRGGQRPGPLDIQERSPTRKVGPGRRPLRDLSTIATRRFHRRDVTAFSDRWDQPTPEDFPWALVVSNHRPPPCKGGTARLADLRRCSKTPSDQAFWFAQRCSSVRDVSRSLAGQMRDNPKPSATPGLSPLAAQPFRTEDNERREGPAAGCR